jgi:small-conductance mechanosensitive channel
MKTRFRLFVGFLGVTACFLLLSRHGVALHTLSGGKTLSNLLALVFAVAAVYELTLLAAEALIRARKGAPSETAMVAAFLRAPAGALILVATLSFLGWLPGSWAAVAGFAGLLMGWSFQAPVSGLAAWAMVNMKRPFRLGDRVMLPAWGLTGDVKQIGMMYTVLDQVGGTVGSEEAAGRSILIPNAMLFGNVVINCTPQQTAAFVLDEVVVRITYSSDWDLAERILMEAAGEVTGDIIQQTGHKPYIRADMYDYGIYMRLRYLAPATDRPRIAYELTKRIFKEFLTRPNVDFAIPFVFSHRTGLRAGARHLELAGEPAAEPVNVDDIRDPSGVASRADGQTQVRDLADKISRYGLLQPIVVQRRADGRYNVVAGHLRLEACKALGWKTISAVIRPSNSSEAG